MIITKRGGTAISSVAWFGPVGTRCFECVGSNYASPLCQEYMLETAADVLAFEV